MGSPIGLMRTVRPGTARKPSQPPFRLTQRPGVHDPGQPPNSLRRKGLPGAQPRRNDQPGPKRSGAGPENQGWREGPRRMTTRNASPAHTTASGRRRAIYCTPLGVVFEEQEARTPGASCSRARSAGRPCLVVPMKFTVCCQPFEQPAHKTSLTLGTIDSERNEPGMSTGPLLTDGPHEEIDPSELHSA